MLLWMYVNTDIVLLQFILGSNMFKICYVYLAKCPDHRDLDSAIVHWQDTQP